MTISSLDLYTITKKLKDSIADKPFLRNKDYTMLTQKVTNATKELLKKKMILHCHYFPSGSPFFYGEMLETKKYIPISLLDGKILEHQTKSSWPLYDTLNKSYFVPIVTLSSIHSPLGCPNIEQYLAELYRGAKFYHNSHHLRILETFTSYVSEIMYVNSDLYQEITSFMRSLK